MTIKSIFNLQEKNEIFDMAKESWIQNIVTDDKGALIDAYADAFENMLNSKGYKVIKEFEVEVLPGSKHNARMNVEQILIQKFKRFR